MDNNAPTPISGLPYELIARIVNHIDSDTDVQHLTRVSRATRFYANERIWRYCDNEKSQELASYPDPVQQQFATSIREIDWEITPADRRDFSRLNFPRLQSLNIAHESGQFGRLRLNQSVQPALRELTIEDGSRGGSRGINQVSRNYIPLLVNCPDLRSLWIEIDPQATDAEFLAAVTSCRQLEFLSLKGPVCRVLKSPMFQHLACHSMLESLHYIAAGLRITQNLIRSTMASLNPGQTIFNQLTTLHTSMDGAAARELFPRMPTITDLTLFIDRDDGIVHWLQDLPQLDRLRLIARANVPLTRHNLRGLRHLHLSALVIDRQEPCAFNGTMITVDDIDTIFGSHGTLTSLRLGWRGDAAHPTFLQHSPHLLLERVIRHYPALQSFWMIPPCGALDLMRMPRAALNGNLQTLRVDTIVGPLFDPNVHPARYNSQILFMACQLVKHLPQLQGFMSNRDNRLANEIERDYRTMKRAGL